MVPATPFTPAVTYNTTNPTQASFYVPTARIHLGEWTSIYMEFKQRQVPDTIYTMIADRTLWFATSYVEGGNDGEVRVKVWD